MRLLLDEHFSPAIAEQLRNRGYDVIPVAERLRAEDAQLRRQDDENLLRRAYDDGRVLVTENIGDFMPIHEAFLTRGEAHAGIIFTTHRKFPRHSGGIGLLITALAVFMDDHEAAGLESDVAWL